MNEIVCVRLTNVYTHEQTRVQTNSSSLHDILALLVKSGRKNMARISALVPSTVPQGAEAGGQAVNNKQGCCFLLSTGNLANQQYTGNTVHDKSPRSCVHHWGLGGGEKGAEIHEMFLLVN